jgi:hypothetical protein
MDQATALLLIDSLNTLTGHVVSFQGVVQTLNDTFVSNFATFGGAFASFMAGIAGGVCFALGASEYWT